MHTKWSVLIGVITLLLVSAAFAAPVKTKESHAKTRQTESVSVDGSVFTLHTTPKTRAAAQASCAASGGMLATLNSDVKMGSVAGLLSAGGIAWIGAHNSAGVPAPVTEWKNEDGSALHVCNMAGGIETVPIPVATSCATIGSEAVWSVHDCAHAHEYICEGAVSTRQAFLAKDQGQKILRSLSTPSSGYGPHVLSTCTAGPDAHDAYSEENRDNGFSGMMFSVDVTTPEGIAIHEVASFGNVANMCSLWRSGQADPNPMDNSAWEYLGTSDPATSYSGFSWTSDSGFKVAFPTPACVPAGSSKLILQCQDLGYRNGWNPTVASPAATFYFGGKGLGSGNVATLGVTGVFSPRGFVGEIGYTAAGSVNFER